MAQPTAGRAGRGGGGRGGRGGRFPKRNEASAPRKTGEVGACKDLDGNVFTIGSGNKGKDGDLLRTSKEKLALYIGTNYGDDACQEWMSEKQLVLLEPTYPPAVLARQAVRAMAISARVTKMITNLEKQLEVIEKELDSDPNDLNLLKNQMEVENKLELAKFELTDVVEVKTTADEAMAFSNSWRTYRERTDRLVRSRGKVYSLVLGQCTTVLLDKMKQDADWQTVSDSFDPLKLLKLIEKYILKQSDNQYKIGIVIEQLKLLLTYRQDDGVTNTAYYDRFKTRVDVAEHIGVSFDNPVLWDLRSQELYSMDFVSLADATKESKVKDDVKQAFLAYLFFINSNDKKHSQLKKTVANDHAKGDIEAYPSSCHAALTLMNDFKPLVIEGTAPVAAQGTAFAQKKGPGTVGTNPGTECNYNKEYFKDKECHNCGKKGHPARCCTQKKKASDGSGDDKSTSSNKSSKSIKSLTKQIKTLKKSVSALQSHQEDSDGESSLSSVEGDSHFQYACAAIGTSHPKIAMALKSPKARDLDLRSVWLLDNQSTFDLCCNPDFAQKKRVAKRAMNMSSNGGDMKISKECKVLGYEFWVWYTQRAMTNILSLKNLIRLYRVTYDSEKRTSFIVHREEFGLPDMVFDMHPCGLHVYYPEKIDGQYGFVQTVAENMKLFTKRQIDGALQARHLYETLGYPSNADFESVLRAGGIGGCTVTVEDAKVAEKIWGSSVPRLKGSTVRESGHRKPQSLVKVPRELIKLQQKVSIAIDIFFVNGQIFFMTFSRKICFTTVTHLVNRKVNGVWAAMHQIYQMYMLRGFHIVEIAGDGEFVWIADQVASLPTNPTLDLAAANEHVGLIERNIRFLKEKVRSLRHSLPFERIPALMLIRMVLHAVPFMNSFPRKGGLKHYPPSAIMTGAQLHMNHLRLKFGSYCQVAEDVTPRNSLAARTRAAISMGPSGNLSGGHRFLALDTGKIIVRNRWKELPMPTAVIDRVNVLGRTERSLLVFTDRQGRVIGDYAPTSVEQADVEEDESVVADLYSSIPPAPDVTPGVSSIEEGSADDIPGVDVADVAVLHEPTGVDMSVPQANTPQVFDDTVFDTDLDGGLDAEPPTLETPANTPPVGMAARNVRVRKPPEKFIPSMQGNKYEIALAQMTASLGKSKNALAFAQMSVKLMCKGEHRRADIVGMVMAQVSLKAALKTWGTEAEEAIGKEMKQLHWRNSFKPMHWKTLTSEQRKQVLESHIFVERKRDGVLKARTVAGGNKQRGYILKEDASSPTVSNEAVMLTCVIDADENRDVAIVDIPNAFVQTVVEDEKDRAFIRIRGPLVDILVAIAPDVYREYVTIGKKGEKQLLVQCLNALYGTMVASLLYYKKFVKSLRSKRFKLNPYDPCVANKQVDGEQLTVCFHVDDCKISHISPKVVSDTIDWLRSEYENVFEDGSGLMKVHRGKTHKYLGMSLDFSHVNQCRITMIDYVDEIVAAYDKASSELDDGFTLVFKKGNRSKSSAAPDDLFVVDEDAEKLSEEGQTAFHHLVAKTLYISKRARPDLSTAIAFLTTRVKAPDIHDWRKLSHMMEYLRVERLRPLILSADGSGVLMWYVDASFAVHPNMRSHTGGGLTMGRGFPIVTSTKQRLNTRSSTESELVGVDDMMPIVVWSRYFLMAQGYGVTQNLLLQDNRSSMLLEKNGRASSGKRTRHINIRYYFVTDRVNMKEIEIEWCPTKEMVADFMTKPLQGSHFRRLRDLIMGMTKVEKSKNPRKNVRRVATERASSPTSVALVAQ
jgi:hypothetical protein